MRFRSPLPRGLPLAVWLIAGVGAVLMSGFGMVVPLLPVYGTQLGAGPVELGLLMAGFFAGRLVAQIPAGLLADRLGRRRVLHFALIGYCATCVGYALAPVPWVLITFRLLQGLSSGFYAVAARSMISDLAGPSLRGEAQGIYSSAVNLGFVAGPVVGAFTASRFGIETPFWGAAVLSLASLVIFVFARIPSHGALAREVFVPVVWSQLVARICSSLNQPRIRILGATSLLYTCGLSVIMTLFPVAGESEIPGGLTVVGPAFTAAGFSGLVFGPLLGRLGDRVGRSPLLLLGALLTAAEGTALLLTRAPELIIGAFFLGGIGAAAFFNALHAAIGDLTNRRRRGTVTGIVGLAGETGGIAGSLLASAAWSLTDLRAPFAIQILATCGVVLLSLFLGRLRTPRVSEPSELRETILPG